jgi:hypothetical protein
MKNEQKKEKDNVSRLEITGLRHNDDFKGIISTIQNEF